MKTKHRTQDTGHSNNPIRDGMAPPPAAGGDGIVSTHTVPEEEQARMYCCIINIQAARVAWSGRYCTRLIVTFIGPFSPLKSQKDRRISLLR